MGDTKIEWTDKTWNPIVGCSIVSPGCTNCYAMKMAARIEAMNMADPSKPESHYHALTNPSKAGPVWTGDVRQAPDHILTAPLRWKKPARIFVNSMGDLFHESVPDSWIDRVFAVMALAPQHTFQVLTKRSKRMREYISAARHVEILAADIFTDRDHKRMRTGYADAPLEPMASTRLRRDAEGDAIELDPWPLPNVHLGVSAEDQPRADERIPDLLATPAAVRFVSAEPLLGPIDFDELFFGTIRVRIPKNVSPVKPFPSDVTIGSMVNSLGGSVTEETGDINWIIVGGESGKGARPCWVPNIRSIIEQCRTAGVACFVKQLGSKPVVPSRGFGSPPGEPVFMSDVHNRKGGDMAEWPEDLRVQEFPHAA